LTLDHWEPEIVRVMNELGNEVVNKIYEGTYDELMCEIERATEFCDDKVRKEWIQAKYVDKKFILPLNDDSKKTDLLPSNLIPSPSKWSVKKYRRRATKRHNNNNDMKITSKEHDNSSDEKEINESILILGDRLTESNYSVTSDASNLFTSSDQESTSGEEDVLGMIVKHFRI
jgi:Arf-GAP with coiled-coil, ANK repeat and PH domain-containing protein